MRGRGEREKEKKIEKRKGMAEMTLIYAELNILTVIKDNGLYTKGLVKNSTQ